MMRCGWSRRALGQFFSTRRREPRGRRTFRLELIQLEDRCLLTATTVPADVWPIAHLVPGLAGDVWYGRLSGTTLGHVSASGDVVQVSVPAGTPKDLQTDAYGNLWFRLDPSDGVASLDRLTPSGSLTTLTNLGPVAARVSDLASPPASYLPYLLFGPDGGAELVGVSSGGAVTLVAAPTTADTADLRGAWGALPVARAADGAFWYPDGGGLARLTADGTFQRFALPPGNPDAVASLGVGPDGNLWFVEARRDDLTGLFYADQIGRLTLDGTLAEARLVSQGGPLLASGFTADAAGNLWFDQKNLLADGTGFLPGSHRIGKVGPGGAVSYYVAPQDDGTALTVGAGPGGNLWTNVPFAYDFTNQYSTDVVQTPLSTLTPDSLRTITFPAPAAPAIRAFADGYTIQHGNALSVAAPGVLANDLPGQAAALTASLVSGPAHGSVTLAANGSFTYTPAAGFQGSDSFVYQAGNGTSVSAATTVTVQVQNQAPVTAGAFFYAVLPGAAMHVSAPGLLAGATDANGDPLTAVLTAGPAHGSLTLNANGSLDYTPAVGFQGADSFTYQVSDGAALSDPTTVTVEVSALPVAHGDSYILPHDRPLRLFAPGLLANDTNPTGTALALTFATSPAHGSLDVSPDGSFVYTPAPGYVGPDSFTYQASAGASASNTATVTLNVTNAAPVASALSFTANQNQTLFVAAPGLFAGASDADGDLLRATVVDSPAHGLLVSDADGSFSYSPSPGYTGSDSFTYQLSDGVASSDVVTVSITVSPHNSPPLITLPSFPTDTTQNVAFTAELPVYDFDGDALTFTLVAGPSHGSVTFGTTGSPAAPAFTYTPAANYTGADSFTYQADDGHGGTATGTVTVTVSLYHAPPAAGDLSATTAEDTPLTGTLPVPGASGGGLQISVLFGPDNGTAAVTNTGGFTYIPYRDYFGTDSFTYFVDDGNGGGAAGTVSVTVTSVNDVPVADSRSVAVHASDPVSTYLPATDADHDLLVATLVSGPAHGTVAFTYPPSAPGALGSVWFTYTPGAGYAGTDSFTYRVDDGHGGTATGTISLATPVQVPPVAQNFSVTTYQDIQFIARLPAYDPNGDFLTITFVSGPSHGVVLLNRRGGLLFNYIPGAGYTGTDSFTYRVDDGNGGTATATATITINSTGGSSGGGGDDGGNLGSGSGGGAAVTIDPPQDAPPAQVNATNVSAATAAGERPVSAAAAPGNDAGAEGRALAVALARGLAVPAVIVTRDGASASTPDGGHPGTQASASGPTDRAAPRFPASGGRGALKRDPVIDPAAGDDGLWEWDPFGLWQFEPLTPEDTPSWAASDPAQTALGSPQVARERAVGVQDTPHGSLGPDMVWLDREASDFHWLTDARGAGELKAGGGDTDPDAGWMELHTALACVMGVMGHASNPGRDGNAAQPKAVGRRRKPWLGW